MAKESASLVSQLKFTLPRPSGPMLRPVEPSLRRVMGGAPVVSRPYVTGSPLPSAIALWERSGEGGAVGLMPRGVGPEGAAPKRPCSHAVRPDPTPRLA